MWVGGISPTPRSLPPGKTRYPFYRRLGGSQGRSGRTKNLVPTRIRSWTVRLVVSRYTDWATRSTWNDCYNRKIFNRSNRNFPVFADEVFSLDTRKHSLLGTSPSASPFSPIRYTFRAADIYTSETLTVFSIPLNISVPTVTCCKLLQCASETPYVQHYAIRTLCCS